ncbi:MAG TPA: hypothetical protein VFG14_12780 [Chthoniobacteraceae bacterium]|nr:hypothetical protein [Chthoniobacteraceae bacterium]
MRTPLLAALLLFPVFAFGVDDYELPPISYSDTQPNDAVSRLQARLDKRELKFTGSESDAVRQILKELNIPEASQMLVFSKTSVQRMRISPQNPRALYFNDDCYVGWVPGGLVEVAAMDAKLGPIFYTIDPIERGSAVQRFRRDASCLSCHAANFTRDIPGVFARSVFAEATGSPIFNAGSEVVDHTTPFEKRWGGWYVTGQHGAGRHRGNVFAHDEGDNVTLDMERGANLQDLSKFIQTSTYPVPTSDIVALMVFEHQLAVHTALTRAGYETRRMLEYQRGLQESFKEPLTDEPAYDSVKSVFKNSTQAVLDALLYKDEAPIPADGIQGTTAFREAFEKSGKHAADRRSLRELELETRLAKYRCSHLIHSVQFRALPKPLIKRVSDRLRDVLHAEKPEERYAYLGADERRTIAAILKETEPELTAGWPR